METFDEFSICKPWELDKDKFYVDATPEEIRHLIACAQAEHPDHIPDIGKMVEPHKDTTYAQSEYQRGREDMKRIIEEELEKIRPKYDVAEDHGKETRCSFSCHLAGEDTVIQDIKHTLLKNN